MYALRERRVHVTQEDFELAVAKVTICCTAVCPATLSWFLRATAATAVARLSHRNSVRLSVRPSHGWISQKRCKLELPNLYRRLPGRL